MNYIYYIFIISMKKLIRPLISLSIILVGGFASLVLAQVISSRNYQYNNVPEYYYANYKFADDWEAILDWFKKIQARYSLDMDIPSSDFGEFARHLDIVSPHLTKDFSVVYEKCSLLARSMSNGYSKDDLEAFMWNSCYKSLMQTINKINSSYTVKPSVTSNPGGWMAPLTVTFDARNSSDPSMETIPENNFYRYYRDEKWIDTPMWEWQIINYLFNDAGKFIVHLVIRSSNVNKWILDGEKNITINVTPKAADIVVYANTRRMSSVYPLKIWISEGEKWVVFDGSLTVPRWWRKILSHRRTITNNWNKVFDSNKQDGAPSYINVPLKWNWLFKITLTTLDNESNSVSETFDLYMSDPVAIIKQTPENWTTSTTFNFDGSASYSITNKLNTYVWEVFDWNWDADNWNKIMMAQGKQMKLNENKKLRPWNYLVRLTITDMAWNTNVETKILNVESTTPIPQFTVTPTSKWTSPSEFTLNANNSLDVDVDNGVDSLEYEWSFSPNKDSTEIISTENNNQRVVVRFNEKWKHKVILTVTDEYWKSASISKDIEVNSTLRPELELKPWPITWGKVMQFKSTVNREVWNYGWDFWDRIGSIESASAKEVQHKYGQRWIYPVKLTVTDKDWDTNTVQEKAFIWEVWQPIAAYKVTNSEWFFIQSSDTCVIVDESWNSHEEHAYTVDRYSKVTINPSISVNTQWTSNWLQYVFEKEEVTPVNQAKISNQLTTSFNELWCHYVDLTVKETNAWKQDKIRIRFNVKNALPTIKNVVASSSVSSDNSNAIWLTPNSNQNQSQSIFACSWSNNITMKVTAVDPGDPDWNVSRLRFYYYNAEDPDRILEYKESWVEVPYVYFVIPKIAWEYKFGVMVYDNDGWVVDSDDYLASNPSLYIPSICENSDVPMVTLKVDRNNIQIWDEVTYTIISKMSLENEDFKADRTFYYDFDWDGTWDLFTKKDTETYTFTDAYEEWITPRAAVEYRWKLWQADGAKIFVKNGIKPVLLSNSIWNTVIFRDLSVWIMQKREICFEKSECEAALTWTKYKRIHVSTTNPNELTWGTKTSITENDYFIRNYKESWKHDISIYFKNKYWIEVTTWFTVTTSPNPENGRIAPWVNMITIPETTLTNANPEIFLNKKMENTLIMYINNESWGDCFVDIDTATDSDWSGETDDDRDVQCNKIAKIKYEPDYESTVWRVYFTNNGKLTFKNFYITFEWIILWLDDEKRAIYNDITMLFNWIEDLSVENTNLKRSLDRLRKNLNNRPEVTSLVNTINDQISEWWLKMDENQKELLESIMSRLSNEDTIILVWKSEYEKNKLEILALLPTSGVSIKKTVEWLFEKFDENLSSSTLEQKAEELEAIRDTIIDEGKNDKRRYYNENDFNPYFCNIFDYFDITAHTKKCWSDLQMLTENYDKWKVETTSKSEKSWWFPLWLKIILIILVWWLLVMWWIIVFFSIKARLSSASDSDEDEW